MGRYPFLETARLYMERRRAFLSPSSVEELERKGRTLNKVFVQLKSSGRVENTNPAKMTRKDISAFILWMREKGHENSYIAKSLGYLKQLCEFTGNPVFAEMKAEGERLPTKTPKELKALSDEDLEAIFAKAEEMTGWYGEVARFLVHFYPFTGVRASELRRASVKDVDIRNWTFTVQHPKGELRYARKRTTIILPPAREATLRFLKAREDRLRKFGIDKCDALVPNVHSPHPDMIYSTSRFRAIKEDLQRRVGEDIEGFEFTLKSFRDTYCQMNIDRNPAMLSAVALTMGHSTTRTTESHYGRIRQEKAFEMLESAWGVKKGKNPLIDQKYEMTGYN